MKTFIILHVEDDSDDAFLVRRAFDRSGFRCRLQRVSDGEQAIACLAGDGLYADRGQWPLPDLVLLDLKLPTVNGFEVLSWIRDQAAFRQLPVVLLSSSEHVDDLKRAEQLGATGYFAKSVQFAEVIEYARHFGGPAVAVRDSREAIPPA